MRFLHPTGGSEDERWGTICTPGTKGIPAAVRAGKPWAADNNAFTQGFYPRRFFEWLDQMMPYQSTCIFVVVPDAVADWVQTFYLYRQWAWRIQALGYPVALAAQDGCEHQHWPAGFNALFIGGSTEWKLGPGADVAIRRAQALGAHVHVGRVNYWIRYQHFRLMSGSDEFTCDGTRIRFERKKTLARWSDYERMMPLFTL